jgi:D-serine deaminase-like pyridoxal phosphate-dependent protein
MLKFPVDAYIKIDTGYHRTGLTHEEMPIIKEVVNVLDSSPLTRFKGLLTHAGHTYHERTRAGIKQIYSSSTEILSRVKEELDTPDRMVLRSYGDTPSCSIIEKFDGIDEIRPGNFVFYDLMQLNAGVCLPSQVAGIVVCPVVAVHPARNQVVIYGGAVHLSKESIPVDGRPVYGQLVEMDEKGWYDPIPDAVVVSLSQEHGILHSPDFVIKSIRPGMVIGIIPVHSCLTASLMQGYQLLGGGKAEYFLGI